MFRIENSQYFFLLFAIIPIIAFIIFIEIKRRKDYKKFVEIGLLQKMLPSINTKYSLIKNIVFLFILIFSIFALANPQWSQKRVKVKSSSSDVIIAQDVSQSMLARDISPERLEKAKKTIEYLILKMKGNNFSLIFFAGEAFLKMPMSPDYAAAIIFTKSATTDLIENQGTAIEEAIDIALKASQQEKEKKKKCLIIFSDGEDHDGNAIEKAKSSVAEGFTIMTVGVGTQAGAFIPQKNEFGEEVFKKDYEGNLIKSKVNQKLLKDVAEAGNGEFYSISDNDIVDKIAKKIESLEKKESINRSFTDYNSQYEYPLVIIILLLIIYIFFPEFKLKKVLLK
jgi:Ca-activated chloride channel family protein